MVRRKTLGWNMNIGKAQLKSEKGLCANRLDFDESSTVDRCIVSILDSYRCRDAAMAVSRKSDVGKVRV